MQRHTVSTVAAYDVFSRSVRFDCRTDHDFVASDFKYREDSDPTGSPTDRTIPVTLTFYDASTFRFSFAANPEAGTTDSLVELNEDAITEPVSLSATKDDGDLRIETDALCVVVGLDEWSFHVEAPDGRVVFSEQRSDVDVRGELRVDPLGFETELGDGPEAVTRTGTAFSLSPGERVLGLGEKFTEFDKRGREITAWTAEPYGTETETSYKNIPFHISTEGYGLLVDTTHRVEYDFGKETTATGTVNVHDDTFEFVFFYGSELKHIHERYTALTGRVTRPPKWSFGVWMSRLGYESREHLEAITDRLREERLPCDVIHLDPFWMREFHSCDLAWDTDQFPDPATMADRLHENNFHLSLWEHPYVPVGSEAFEEGIKGGFFVRDRSGKPYLLDSLCQGDYRGAIVDFTDPDAVEWWKAKNRRLVEMGVDVFKTDYGEGVPPDAVFENGRTGESMHNFYPYLYNRAVYEAVEDVVGSDDALIWGRAAWTGSQRFPMYWGGDSQTSFNGMASALRGGLSLSLSGFPFWSHDIGGFRGTPSTKVYIRWIQFGLLSSHARCHGTTPREPWAFGENAIEVYRRFAEVRYSLIPYLYSYAEVATRCGLPVVRPLVLEYNDDPMTHDLATEYLLGEELLVAPVLSPDDEVSVYLPEGEWIDYWTGKRYEGHQTLERAVPLDEVPLFICAESIIPTRESTQTVQDGTPDEVVLRVTPLASGDTDATFRFFDEDVDELYTIRCQYRLDDGTVDLQIPREDRTHQFVAEIEHAPIPVAEVTVNGHQLVRVDADPEPGEWTQGDETVINLA